MAFVDFGAEYGWGHRETVANAKGDAYEILGSMRVRSLTAEGRLRTHATRRPSAGGVFAVALARSGEHRKLPAAGHAPLSDRSPPGPSRAGCLRRHAELGDQDRRPHLQDRRTGSRLAAPKRRTAGLAERASARAVIGWSIQREVRQGCTNGCSGATSTNWAIRCL